MTNEKSSAQVNSIHAKRDSMPSERQLPPLSTLRIFEVAARRQSFLLAGAELNLTPGAVSKQIKQLEVWLGQSLFERRHRKVQLTEAGAIYFDGINQVFTDIATITNRVMVRSDKERLVLWCPPWFLRAWLMPRLAGFRLLAPNIQLDVLMGKSDDVISPRADIAIQVGSGKWPGTKSDFLMHQEMTAVCTRQYLSRENLSMPYDFREFILLDSANVPHTAIWKRAAGLEGVAPKECISFPSNETSFAAALNGHGLAMVNFRFVEKQVVSGDLVRPWDINARTNKSYYLNIKEKFAPTHAAIRFRNWLLKEIEPRDAKGALLHCTIE